MATFILLSANAFNLDQSKILSFGKELITVGYELLQHKNYPDIYTSLKRGQFTTRMENLLRQKVYKLSQDIMRNEGKEFKPEVMLQKSTPKDGGT